MNGPAAQSVTVIVPAFNESAGIAQALAALKRQTYPAQRFEVVVVDNGSTDETALIVQSRGVRLLHEPRKSAYRARNLAIRSSDGDWLAFIDADCIAEPDWLAAMWQAAVRSDARLVAGLTLYEPVKDNVGTWHLLHTHRPEVLRERIETHHCVAAGNMLVHRSLFDELGLFHELPSGSDIEFSRSVADAGYRIVFAPEAKVRHQCDLSNLASLRRSFSTRHGQALHSARSGLRGFAANLRGIPWRPGFRVERPQRSGNGTGPGAVAWWLFCWMHRWFGFCGAQWAMAQSLFGPRWPQLDNADHNPPGLTSGRAGHGAAAPAPAPPDNAFSPGKDGSGT